MSGKRKKDDSETIGIMKFFKSTERNRISSKEPSDIAERSSISSATESVQINESTRPFLHLLTITLHVRAAEQSRPQ